MLKKKKRNLEQENEAPGRGISGVRIKYLRKQQQQQQRTSWNAQCSLHKET